MRHTIGYKGCYIHLAIDNNKETVQVQVGNTVPVAVKSLQAAKLYITKKVKHV